LNGAFSPPRVCMEYPAHVVPLDGRSGPFYSLPVKKLEGKDNG
jgi:hypothetical protein